MEGPERRMNRRIFLTALAGGLLTATGLEQQARADLPKDISNDPADLGHSGISWRELSLQSDVLEEKRLQNLDKEHLPSSIDDQRRYLDPDRLKHLEPAPSEDKLKRRDDSSINP
ncbi:hypothetical protein HY414_00980 [Candidatus Kaiserbacteria bacterium]|nr:hypothetical protein [Candidatus Kaiserbacteria bacterium]